MREAIAGTKQTRAAAVTAFALTWLLWVAPAICEPIAYDTPEWQKEIAHGCLPYHRLVRDDFPIDDTAHSQYAMYTAGFFHYHYKYVCSRGEHHVIVRITVWKVRSGFNRNKSSRKSWFKFVEKLLPHEQGHLDLNELHSRRVAQMDPGKLPAGTGETEAEAIKDLQGKLKALSNRTSKDGQAEQDAYDTETAHGTNKPRQLAATAAIQKRLKQAGITYAGESSGDQIDAASEPKAPLDEAGRALKKNR